MKKFIALLLSITFIIPSFSACSTGPKIVETLSEKLDSSCSHSFSKWETVAESTCSEQGRKERSCSKCGGKEIRLYETLPHKEETVKGTPATCHTTGVGDGKKCTVCGEITDDGAFLPIDQSLHEFEDITIEPTLLVSGSTKKICTICGFNKDAENKGPVDPTILGLPVLNFDGSYRSATKSKPVTVKATVKGDGLNFTCYATLKWQGNTSIQFDKKNYTVKFYKDEGLTDKYKFDPFGWGKENEYCLKANWIDATQARNVVNARLWGQICATRKKLDPNLKDLPNYGAIDGYPVLVYMNGEFHGMYTMNIPKDKWMFDMKNDETKRQAILMGAQWGESSKLNEEIPKDLGPQWEIEHCSTENEAWVRDSFNRVIRFLNTADDETFKRDLDKYIDKEASIDFMIFVYTIGGWDNYGKNILYATFDGKKWIPSVYDLDTSWGLYWDGTKYEEPGIGLPIANKTQFVYQKAKNKLFARLLDTHKTEIVARYNELRATVLSNQHLNEEFSSFVKSFPLLAQMAEEETWPELPFIKNDHDKQLLDYIPKQMAKVDAFFQAVEKMKR